MAVLTREYSNVTFVLGVILGFVISYRAMSGYVLSPFTPAKPTDPDVCPIIVMTDTGKVVRSGAT